MEPNKILIIGQGEAKAPLRAVADSLKKLGILPSCYFDADIKRAVSFLPDVGFVLVGLSRAAREVTSEQHKLEKKLFEAVAKMEQPVPCGILRDTDGYISAPYLTLYGNLVRLVCADAHDGQPAPLDLFNGFRLLTIGDAVELAGEIAEEIRSFLHVTPVTI